MTKTQANILIALLVVLIGAVVNNTRVVGKPSITWDQGTPYLTNGLELQMRDSEGFDVEYEMHYAYPQSSEGKQITRPLTEAR